MLCFFFKIFIPSTHLCHESKGRTTDQGKSGKDLGEDMTSSVALVASVSAGGLAGAGVGGASAARGRGGGRGADGGGADGDRELLGNGVRLLDDPLDQTNGSSTASGSGREDTLPQVLGDHGEGPVVVDTGRALDNAAVPSKIGEDELVVFEDAVGEGNVVEEDLDSLLKVGLEVGLAGGVLQEAVDHDGAGEGSGVLGVGPLGEGWVDSGDVDTESGIKVLGQVEPPVVLGRVAVKTVVGLHLPVAVPVTGEVLEDHEADVPIQIQHLVNLGDGGIVSLDGLVPELTERSNISWCTDGGERVDDPGVVRVAGGVVGEGGSRGSVKEGTVLCWGLATVEHGVDIREFRGVVQDVEGSKCLVVDEETDHVGLVGVGSHGATNIGVELLTDLGGVLLLMTKLEEGTGLVGLTSSETEVPALLGVVLLLACAVNTEVDILIWRKNNIIQARTKKEGVEGEREDTDEGEKEIKRRERENYEKGEKRKGARE